MNGGPASGSGEGGGERLSLLAHELKTPLAVIVGYSELLRARDDERTRRQAAEQIHQAARLLSSRIDRLLVELADAHTDFG